MTKTSVRRQKASFKDTLPFSLAGPPLSNGCFFSILEVVSNEREKMRGFLMIEVIVVAAMVSGLITRAGQAESFGTGASLLEEMRRIELESISYDQEATPYYGYIKGSIPILISAPHGAKHFRAAEGAWRAEDAYTASLAIVLGRLTGAHVLYVKNKTREDPNSDTGTAYKDFLKDVVRENHIQFILDLHGSAGRKPKVDIGIMETSPSLCSCPQFRDILEGAFADLEPIVFNQRFPARAAGTITCFARKSLGIEAAQVEISRNYRIVESKSTGFKADPKNVVDMIERLKKVILAISERIGRASP